MPFPPEIPENVLDVLAAMAKALQAPAVTTADLEELQYRLNVARARERGAEFQTANANASVVLVAVSDAAFATESAAATITSPATGGLLENLAREFPWFGQQFLDLNVAVAMYAPDVKKFLVDYALGKLLDAVLEQLGISR